MVSISLLDGEKTTAVINSKMITADNTDHLKYDNTVSILRHCYVGDMELHVGAL